MTLLIKTANGGQRSHIGPHNSSREMQTEKLENSYAGIMQERPLSLPLRPLGFDWKIGIALITSFRSTGGICRHNGYFIQRG
jgi:Fe2+ transport system protein B